MVEHRKEEMKTLDEIQEEVKLILKDWNWPEENVEELFNNPAVLTLVEEVAHRFAKEACREALKNASENATYILDAIDEVQIVKSSITSEDNIPSI